MLLAPVTKSPSKIILIFRGGSGIFSKGGGGFSKQNSKTLTPFFKVDQIDFLSSPKALKRRCLGKVFCAAGKLLKKRSNPFLELFGNFDKIAFLWRALRFNRILIVLHELAQQLVSENSII